MDLKDTGKNNSITFGENLRERNFKLNIVGDNNVVTIGSGVKISHCNLTLKGHDARMTISDNVELNGLVLSMFRFCSLSIGALTTMGNGLITIAEECSVRIGDDCMFAHDYQIRTSDMHPIYSGDDGKRINFGESISIGNHVWTGTNVSILKGVNIFDNCVIGTQSLVNRSIQETGVVAAGNPATIIKRNIVWGRKMFHETAMDDPRLSNYIDIDQSIS